MICYRFPDQVTWQALAIATGLARMEDGSFTLIGGHRIAIDDIGPLTDYIGHHVNMIHPNPPPELDPYLIVVATADRQFLGGPSSAPSPAILQQIANG